MSQSTPPPQPPQSGPVDGNPYAGQTPAPAPGTPYPPQQAAFGAPPAPPAPARNNLVLGLVAAVVAAVVVGALYGLIIGATKHEIGWAAVGVGFVVGLAAGKVGGRNPVLPVVGAILALGSVYLGQLVGEAMIIADHFDVSFNEVFFDHLDVVQKVWKEDADPLTFVFFAIAAFAAFSGSKKAAG
ncbi:hypothetical protein GCM10010503_01970 [Streptomyces lucensis JCM 4490]|uniref:Uncharacterized protein n=1 Tax=Streptomyces lucensis JCM 4490 TaxID=1306176 RepID=A0A918ITQ5_9ACTN|nr:hypothetical protein [Streptomyces lucensis]GGW30098.1 hypothetical protein GCM10010503_01970 [Streptomyces lucensis JCM 4490]